MKIWKKLQWYYSKGFVYVRKSTLLFILGRIPDKIFYKAKPFRRKIYVELSERRKKGFNKIVQHNYKFMVYLQIKKLREAKVEVYEPYLYRIIPRKTGFVVEFKKEVEEK